MPKYQIKYGKMPKGIYPRNKLLQEIWQLSEGTGVMPMSKWALHRENGKQFIYNNKIAMRVIPPVLKVVKRTDEDLTPEAKSLFEKNKKISVALQYIGDPDELTKAVELIESRKI